jgi:hypothetical protein
MGGRGVASSGVMVLIASGFNEALSCACPGYAALLRIAGDLSANRLGNKTTATSISKATMKVSPEQR